MNILDKNQPEQFILTDQHNQVISDRGIPEVKQEKIKDIQITGVEPKKMRLSSSQKWILR